MTNTRLRWKCWNPHIRTFDAGPARRSDVHSRRGGSETTGLFSRGLTVLAVAALSCCAGCIELSQVLSIGKDGSGTLELDYSLPDNTAAQMKAILELRKEMIKAAGRKYEPTPVDTRFALFADPADRPIRELIAGYKSDGIVLEDLKIEAMEGRRRVRMNLRFANLAKAAGTDLFRAHWPITLVKQTDGTYQLNLTNGQPGEEPNLDYSDPATLKSIEPILSGFNATVRINPPGEIVHTSAARKSDHSAAWTFNFSESPRAFSAFQTANMSVRFKSERLALPDITAAAPAP